MRDVTKRKNIEGFTLIELIVVIAVLAILAAVILPRFLGFTDDAREKSTLSDAKNIATVVESILAENEVVLTPANVWSYMGRTFPACSLTIDDADDGDFTYLKSTDSDDTDYEYTAVYTASTGDIVVTEN